MIPDNFYTYALLDPRKPGVWVYGEQGEYTFNFEPFYGGKGKNKRWKDHLKKSNLKENNYKNNKIKKILFEGLELIVVKIKENLIECVSLKYEMNMIKTIGRLDLGTGPLTNNTDGGEGNSGWVPSEETRKKQSDSRKGKIPWNKGIRTGPQPEEIKKKRTESLVKYYKENPDKIRSGENGNRFGMHNSEEQNRKLSESITGEKHWHYGGHNSEEQKKKQSESGKQYYIEHPDRKRKVVETRKRNKLEKQWLAQINFLCKIKNAEII